MNNSEYKIKYQDLKLKFYDSIDLAYRLGVEQGLQMAQLQQAQQQQAEQMTAPQGQMTSEEGQPQIGQEQPDGSELDQHIGTLESMLQKAESTSPEAISLKKSLEGLKSFQLSLKQASDMRKSEQAIKSIGKSLKAPFTLSKSATKNLSEPAKKALSMQEQIVSDLLKSMAEEETKLQESVTKTLNLEQLLKG